MVLSIASCDRRTLLAIRLPLRQLLHLQDLLVVHYSRRDRFDYHYQYSFCVLLEVRRSRIIRMQCISGACFQRRALCAAPRLLPAVPLPFQRLFHKGTLNALHATQGASPLLGLYKAAQLLSPTHIAPTINTVLHHIGARTVVHVDFDAFVPSWPHSADSFAATTTEATDTGRCTTLAARPRRVK
jgi:hypothetical protein